MIRVYPLVRKRAIHGAFRFAVKRTFAFLLALIMAGTPLSPVFAVVAGSSEAHADHVSHDCDHRVDGSPQADHHSKSCAQHDSCAGQDRDCCAHCFGLVSIIQAAYLHTHPVQTPVLSQLHSLVLITSPDRPPRSFSL
jgi:hypothetical protein